MTQWDIGSTKHLEFGSKMAFEIRKAGYEANEVSRGYDNLATVAPSTGLRTGHKRGLR